MTKRRVAITGASGVIGRELVGRILAAGDADILTLDREPMLPALREGVRHVQVELATSGMEELMAFSPQEVYHLAAAFERSDEEPEFWDPNFNDNVLVTHRLHSALRQIKTLQTYVFASSYLIYQPDLYLFGAPQSSARKLKEDDPIAPRNLCGAAKFLAEREIAFMSRVDKLPFRTVMARIYRVYGRGSRCVVSRWVRSLLKDEAITLYNGENLFDYVFAGDVAEGLLRLAAAPAGNGIVNLSNGHARAVKDVVQTLRHQINGAAQLIRVGQDCGPYEASEADIGRLISITGWHPPTSLEEGIARIIDHERSRQEA